MKGKLNEHSLKSGDEARGERLVQTVADAALDCGDCGHAAAEHNDQGDCMHYDFGGCCCFKYVLPGNATPAMRANRLFGRNMWHSLYSFRLPFVPGSPCNREGCEALATRRILCNIWGTICEFETCEPCGERFHGKLLDDFPSKRNPAPAGPSGDELAEGDTGSKGGF